MGCVTSCRQRYGVTVIIDTVRGSNNAKIRQYRMDQNPYYGTLSDIPAFRLRQIFNHLLVAEYLTLSNDEYTIVKLTPRSKEIISGEAEIVMKMARDQKPEEKAKKPKSKLLGTELSEADEGLFNCLRSLRSEIAKEERIPPYMVFSDKSLAHMCVLKPRTKDEMLNVTGVGEFKYKKYGQRFLETVIEELDSAL